MKLYQQSNQHMLLLGENGVGKSLILNNVIEQLGKKYFVKFLKVISVKRKVSNC